MDFSLSEEQQLLKNSARDFLSTECPKSVIKEIEESETGHSPQIWNKMAELGWMGVAIPEEYEGAGMSLLDLAVLFEEFGRAAMPGPLFCTLMLGAYPILEHGSEEQKKSFLPGVAAGKTILTMAIFEPEVDSDPKYVSAKASAEGDKFTLSGTKLFVPYASVADYILVVARTDGSPGDEKGLTVFIVDASSPGISLTPLKTIAADKQSEMALEGVTVSSSDVLGTVNKGLEIVESAINRATAIQCAEMIGGAQYEMEITAEYARTRVQFERPIGTFQAVQHRMADMFIDCNGARWTTYRAIWRLSEGMPAEKELAVAKAFANIATQRISFGAQGIHAGVGVDMNHELPYYFRHQKAFDLQMGTTGNQLKALEEALGF
ncbi:MAG: acyl-CoA dehydrogenase family protein [Dehalococcoidia bacterium]